MIHGYKTLILCLVLGLCYFIGRYVVGQGEAVIENAEWFVVAIATLYTGNDLGGALRERARQPRVPDTVATVEADTVNVEAPR